MDTAITVNTLINAYPTPAQVRPTTDKFSRSFVVEVTAGIIDQNGISIMVYVTPQRIYITAKYIINALPDTAGAANNAYKTNAFKIVPVNNHGRNLPHLEFVLATTTPINGSLAASNTRAIIKINPTKVADKPKIS